MKKCHNFNGFTLVELVTVIAIISIIVVFCAPSVLLMLKRQEADFYQAAFRDAFSTARATAMSHHQPVSFCGSSSLDAICDHDWNHGISIFIDTNNNRLYDGTDQLVKFIPINIRFGTLKLKISLGQRVMKFSPDRGLPAGSFGSFIYCSDEPKLIRSLIFSRMGIFRNSKDSNGDSVHDDNGNAIDCS